MTVRVERGLRAVDLSAAPTFQELVRRAKISLNWGGMERRKAHARQLRSLMKDPKTLEDHKTRLEALNERRRALMSEKMAAFNRRPERTIPKLDPPMSKKELRRYKYMREKGGSREASLAVVVMDREALSG